MIGPNTTLPVPSVGTRDKSRFRPLRDAMSIAETASARCLRVETIEGEGSALDNIKHKVPAPAGTLCFMLV